MANYRSLVKDGFFSSTPYDKNMKVSIRCNNPGAVNGAVWEEAMPGYVTTDETTPGNKTTIFETPEQGVAVYWELLRRYRDTHGLKTVRQIITRYIGEKGAAGYIASVTQQTGLSADTVIDINSDSSLLPFAKAQFRHEAGKPTPLSDAQIVYGFNLGRGKGVATPPTQIAPVTPAAPAKPISQGILAKLVGLFSKSPPVTPPPVVPAKTINIYNTVLDGKKVWGVGDSGDVVKLIQTALRSGGHELLVDGDYGSATVTAVKVFQAARYLTVDGYVGIETARALDAAAVSPINIPVSPLPSALKGAPWVTDVRACTGVKEVPGAANSPIIMAWRKDVAREFPEMAKYAATYTADSIPWCGFGLAAAMARVRIAPPFGDVATDKFMWADSWSRWGTKLEKPIPGCVMTFTRQGGGHVAILEKLVGSTAYIRGFNQSDMVNVAKKDMGAFTAATWPKGFPVVDVVGDISNSVDSGKES